MSDQDRDRSRDSLHVPGSPSRLLRFSFVTSALLFANLFIGCSHGRGTGLQPVTWSFESSLYERLMSRVIRAAGLMPMTVSIEVAPGNGRVLAFDGKRMMVGGDCFARLDEPATIAAFAWEVALREIETASTSKLEAQVAAAADDLANIWITRLGARMFDLTHTLARDARLCTGSGLHDWRIDLTERADWPKAFPQGTDDMVPFLRLARFLVDAGRTTMALDLMQKVVTRIPNDFDTLLLLARIRLAHYFARQGHCTKHKGLDFLHNYCRLVRDPDIAKKLSPQIDDIEDARKALVRARSIRPSNTWRADVMLGVVEMVADRTQQALERFQTAEDNLRSIVGRSAPGQPCALFQDGPVPAEIAAEVSELYNDYGIALMKAGRLREATACVSLAWSAMPSERYAYAGSLINSAKLPSIVTGYVYDIKYYNSHYAIDPAAAFDVVTPSRDNRADLCVFQRCSAPELVTRIKSGLDDLIKHSFVDGKSVVLHNVAFIRSSAFSYYRSGAGHVMWVVDNEDRSHAVAVMIETSLLLSDLFLRRADAQKWAATCQGLAFGEAESCMARDALPIARTAGHGIESVLYPGFLLGYDEIGGYYDSKTYWLSLTDSPCMDPECHRGFDFDTGKGFLP